MLRPADRAAAGHGARAHGHRRQQRPGAGTAIGAAPGGALGADGARCWSRPAPRWRSTPWLYKKLPVRPGEGLRAGRPDRRGALMVVVHPSVQANTLAELVALAKSRPDGLSYGSAGNGSPQHLGAEMFKVATAAHLSARALQGQRARHSTDLLGGQLQLMFTDIAPGAAACAQRQAARTRRDLAQAPARGARGADGGRVGRGGHRRLRSCGLAEHRRARGTPKAVAVERYSQRDRAASARSPRCKLENEGWSRPRRGRTDSSTPRQLETASTSAAEAEALGTCGARLGHYDRLSMVVDVAIDSAASISHSAGRSRRA